MVKHTAPEGYTERASGLLVPEPIGILAAGRYVGQIVRNGVVIDEFDVDNLVVNQGLNYLLGAALGNQTVISTWYIGLFTGNYTPLSTDTAATIAGNATEATAITAGVRATFSPASPASQSITNSATQASFTFNAGITVFGAFLASTSTISGTSGTLFSAAQFASSKTVSSGDQLLLTYTFSAASA